MLRLKRAFRRRRGRRSKIWAGRWASDGGFGRYECIELRKQGADRVYAAGSEMRCDARGAGVLSKISS
jgi:hypothetical protein